MYLVRGPLRYFLEVANTGSITEASDRLHVATSAISRQIAKLEHDAGIVLFERLPRGMVLTEAGQLLAGYARRSLQEEEQVLTEIRDLRRLHRRTVKVACVEGLAQDFLPRAMASFRESHPGVRFKLDVTTPAAATQQVREGTCDVAVTFSMAPATGVRVEYSERDPVYALVTAEHPLASRDAVELKDLLEHPLALLTEGTTIRQLLDIACSLEGLTLDPVFVTNQTTALHGFAQLTHAVTLTGRMSARHWLDTGLVVVPLATPELLQRSLQVQTMAQRVLPTPVRSFVVELIAELSEATLPDRQSR